jgi:hypothetical protein
MEFDELTVQAPCVMLNPMVLVPALAHERLSGPEVFPGDCEAPSTDHV